MSEFYRNVWTDGAAWLWHGTIERHIVSCAAGKFVYVGDIFLKLFPKHRTEKFRRGGTSIVAKCCQLSPMKACDQCDRLNCRQANSVDNTCDGRRLQFTTVIVKLVYSMMPSGGFICGC